MEIYVIIFAITSGLSLLGSISLIVMFLFGTDKSGPFKKVFWMSICDLGLALKFWIGQISQAPISMEKNKALCLLSAISGNFFGIATVSWYFIIALCVYAIFQSRESRWRWILLQDELQHIYVWSVAIFGALLPWWGNSYGDLDDGTECWIPGKQDLMKLTIEAPVYLGLVFNFYLIGYVFFMSKTTLTLTSRLKERMFAFVCIFMFCWFWPGLATMWGFISPETFPPNLHYMDVGAVSGSGFCNFIVWITHPVYKTAVCDCFAVEESTATRTLIDTTEGESTTRTLHEFSLNDTVAGDSENIDF